MYIKNGDVHISWQIKYSPILTNGTDGKRFSYSKLGTGKENSSKKLECMLAEPPFCKTVVYWQKCVICQNKRNYFTWK